jgi:hypothetical protein
MPIYSPAGWEPTLGTAGMRPRGPHGGGTRRTGRRAVATLVAAAALLVLPASAHALTLSGLTAEPVGTNAGQAGAHKDFHIHMDFGGGQVKDLTVGLPPGLIGDPNAAPLCTVDQLNADTCPEASRVGSVSANATVTVVALPVPVTVNGDLYNLTPQPGEPARFGIVLRPVDSLLCPPLPEVLCDALPPVVPNVTLQSGVQLRPDFGLNTVINNIPNKTAGLNTTINSQDITLFGTAPGTGKPFMRNPTSCKEHTTNFTAVPYSGSTAHGTANFTTTGCDALDFSPAFEAQVGGVGQTTNGVPTSASTSILQDFDEAGLLKAVVKVPSDLNPNATIFFGGSCDQASFQAGTCPSNTVVGFATAASPLLSQPLVGNVELVAASGSPFPNLGLDLKGQLHLLLQGSTDVSAGNTVTFGDVPPGLPDIPISRFQLTFTNPPGLLGTSRDICVPPAPTFHADFTGYNGKTSSVDAAARVDGCGVGTGGNKAKCKKAKKHKKKHRAAEAKKKHKKKSCKKKKRKHKKRR